MPTKIGRSRKAKGLVGAVVLTASFTLMPISDTLAESGGSCGFAIGAVEGSDDFSNKSNCLGPTNLGFGAEDPNKGGQARGRGSEGGGSDVGGSGSGGGFGY